MCTAVPHEVSGQAHKQLEMSFLPCTNGDVSLPDGIHSSEVSWQEAECGIALALEPLTWVPQYSQQLEGTLKPGGMDKPHLPMSRSGSDLEAVVIGPHLGGTCPARGTWEPHGSCVVHWSGLSWLICKMGIH